MGNSPVQGYLGEVNNRARTASGYLVMKDEEDLMARQLL